MFKVKTNDGHEFECETYEVKVNATEHELVLHNYTSGTRAGNLLLISISGKPRQATDPLRCLAAGVYDEDGALVTSVHADGSPEGTEMHEVEQPNGEVVEEPVPEEVKSEDGH